VSGLLTALQSSTAIAAVTTVCVDLDLGDHMVDASTRNGGASGGEGPQTVPYGDFLEDHGRITVAGSDPLAYYDHPFPASRWLVRVVDDATGEPLWGFAPLDEDGCTPEDDPVPYDAEAELRVEFVRWAQFDDDRAILGYDCVPHTPEEQCTFGFPGDDPEDFSGTATVAGISPIEDGTTYVTISAYYDSDEVNEIGEGFGIILAPTDYALWASQFSETRVQVWPSATYQVYLAHDYDNSTASPLPVGTSNASVPFAGHPTVSLFGPDYRRKFVVAHEYGHIQTATIPGIPNNTAVADYNYDGMGSHNKTSFEFQSAAALEGFADAYNAWVWNDSGSTLRLANGSAWLAVPSFDFPNCSSCPAGVANVWDWASALVAFQEGQGVSLSKEVVLQLLWVAYADLDGTNHWVPNGTSSQFWDNFIEEVDDVLDGGQLADWQDVADAWEIDQ
jgi:hypothetical protein